MKHGTVVLICCVGLLLGARTRSLDAASDTAEITVVATLINAPSFYFTLPVVEGTFEASGDVEDEGDVSGSLWIASFGWGAPPISYWYLGLVGENGTLIVSLHVQSGTWVVVDGSGDYERASGGGTFTTATNGSWPVEFTWTLSGSVEI